MKFKISFRDVAEIIAVVSVIISLIFIGLEFRQNTIATRAAAYQELGMGVADVLFDLSDRPQVNRGMIYATQSLEKFASLSEEDQTRTIQFIKYFSRYRQFDRNGRLFY